MSRKVSPDHPPTYVPSPLISCGDWINDLLGATSQFPYEIRICGVLCHIGEVMNGRLPTPRKRVERSGVFYSFVYTRPWLLLVDIFNWDIRAR